MSLVFSAVSAHTPLLMPTIGKDSLPLLEKTKNAMQQLEQELYLTQPETIIVISPHGNALSDAISINLSPKYITDFKDFGDLVTKLEWRSDVMLIDRIREDCKKKHMPLTLESSPRLDYGTAVPLYYLSQHLPALKVVPVTTAQLDMKTHYEFGRELKDEIMSSVARVAVIASADLSHRLNENAPGGFSPKGVEFDERIVRLMETGDTMGILDITEADAIEARACGAKAMAALLGVLDEVAHKTTVLSYEKPFGVGYLVAQMKIS